MKKLLLLLLTLTLGVSRLSAGWTTSPPASATVGQSITVAANVSVNFTTPSGGNLYIYYSYNGGANVVVASGGGGGMGTISIPSSGTVTNVQPGTYVWTMAWVGGGSSSGLSGPITTVVGPQSTTFSFSNLTFNYDGTAKTASVSPSPANATYTADLTRGPSSGSYTVSATAYGAFAGSGSATLTINNIAPTISWSNIPATAYVNQWFNVQAKGYDADGNISYVYVWRDGQPFALDGFPNGFTQYSDNNAAMSSVPGTITFTAKAGDAAGADSGVISQTVTIINRAPTVTISTSPTTINFGQTTTATAVATDLDGNLAFHGILTLFQDSSNWYRGAMCDHSTGWGNHPTTPAILSASYTSGAVSGGTSTEWIVHQPQWVGTITYHTNAHDGIIWCSNDPAAWAASVGYAYVTVNKATPNQSGWVARSWTGTGAAPAGSFNVSFSNPYSAAVAAPTGTPAFSIVSASGFGASPTSGTVNASTIFYPGTYTVRCAYPGDINYNAQNWDVTFTVGNQPSAVSITANGVGTSTITYGQTATIAATGTDPDGNLYNVDWMRYDGQYYRPGAADMSRIGWNGYPADGAYYTSQNFTNDAASGSGPVTKSAVFRPFSVGTFNFLGYAGDGLGNWGAWAYVVVNPASLTITANNASRVYGAANPSFTASYAGLVNGDTSAVVSGLSLTTPATTTSAPGTYAIVPSGGSAASYTLSYVNGALTISKAPATITLGNLSPTYDGTPKAVTATTSPAGLAVSITYNGSATVPTNAGSYPVVATINDVNYTGSTSSTLIINPQPVTFTFSNTSLYYNAQQQAPLITINPAIATTTITGTSYATMPNAYSFTITANGNYAGSAVCNWAIGCCPATVTLGNLNFTYDGTPKIPTYSTTPVPLSVAFTYTLLPTPPNNPTSTAPFHAGSYTVLATVNSGPDTNGKVYLGSTTGTMVIAKINQAALTLNASTTQIYGTTQTLTTTGGSGTGAISFAIVGQSTTGVATLSGAVLTANSGTGWVDVQATKALDTDYNVISSSVVRVNLAKAAQTALTLNASTTQTYNTTQTLSITGGSSTGAVSYTMTPTPAGVATLAGAVLTANSGTGTADVQATKAGDTNYNAVSSTVVRVNLAKANQTALTLNASTTQTYNTTQTLSTTGGSSTGTVSYTVTPTPAGVATLAGAVLTANSGTGTADVQATKAGDTNYNAVSSTVVRVNLAKANQTALTLNASTTQTYNTTQTLTTTGGTGTGTVSYTVTPTPAGVATLVGAVLTANSGTGTADVQATKAADLNYNAVSSTVVRVNLAKANQAALTLNASTTQTYNTTQTLTTTGGSGSGTVSYTVTPAPAGVATLVGAVLTANSGTGTADVQATKAGDTNYNAVSSSVVRVNLAKANQAALTINSAATNLFGVPYTATAIGGSGSGVLVWTLDASSTATGAAINSSSGAVTSTSAGSVVFNVYKTGDTNYNQSATTANFPLTVNLDPFQAWEIANGLNPYLLGNAQLDPDGDGLTNVAEYNLGTNPNAPNQGTSITGGAIPAGWSSLASDGDTTKAVGATAGELNVDKSGALNYSVPIWTTPGTAGMEPKVSLNYSSQAGNGVAGFGWSLSGMSAITRGGQTKAIDGQNLGVTITASDRFYLDGQRLILISGIYGMAGSEYRTELDSFTKVVAYGTRGTGPARFKAQTKAGLTIWFGSSTDDTTNDGSTFDAWGHTEPFNWVASKISDTKGNYMTFTYYEDALNGVHRLSRIDYTGSTAVSPYASLRFNYENRPDTSFGYAAGSPVSNLMRLSSIQSCFGETVARTYTLGYTNRTTANQRSLLTSLTETGSDGRSYPPLTFAYEAPTGGWTTSNYYDTNHPWLFLYSTTPLAQAGSPTGAGLMDLNGDGYPDFVRKKMSSDNFTPLYNDVFSIRLPAGASIIRPSICPAPVPSWRGQTCRTSVAGWWTSMVTASSMHYSPMAAPPMPRTTPAPVGTPISSRLPRPGFIFHSTTTPSTPVGGWSISMATVWWTSSGIRVPRTRAATSTIATVTISKVVRPG